MEIELYILDMIGTYACAIYGSYSAIRLRFDILGIFICGFLTAVGGGTIREVLAGNIPFYFYDMSYLYTILLGCTTMILFHEFFDKIKTFALIFDSIGLVTFAFIGASKAVDLKLGTFGVISFATITAVGGGVLRDIILNKIPEVMHRDFYSSVAILLGLVYSFFPSQMSTFIGANVTLGFFLFLRFMVIRYKVNLWRPVKEN